MADSLKNPVFSPEDVITFAAGIPGFEHNKEFIIVRLPDYLPFEWLVAADGSGLRFAIVNPMAFRPDYAPNIIKEQLGDLKFDSPDDVLLYTIVTIRPNPAESTVNLIGPVFINKTRRIGKQIIIDDDRYSTRDTIFKV